MRQVLVLLGEEVKAQWREVSVHLWGRGGGDAVTKELKGCEAWGLAALHVAPLRGVHRITRG